MSIFPSQFGLFPFIFLVYMLFPILSLTKETGFKQSIGYVMLVLFLVTYRQLYWSMGKKVFTYWLVIQLSITFLFSIFYDLNYIFLGFFPANFIGWYREKPNFYRGIVCLALVVIIPFIYNMKSIQSTNQLLYFIPFIIIMIFSPFGIRSMNRRMELEKKLDQANQQIEELIKQEERVRIARDLHDTLGHTLSLLTLKSQLVQRLVTIDSKQAKAEAKEMEITSRSALKQVRELVTDMRSINIAEELIHIQQILKTADITYQYDGEDNFSEIPPITQNIVSMCIREAVTNIVKHSKATHCTISIAHSTEKMNIMIRDDGMGLDKNKLVGNGLRGIGERLALIDGTLELSTNYGAVIKMTVPIIKKAEQRGAII